MCLLCPFPIVKAISVRLQYFKDKTKQSICLGTQKSPLVCPFSGEQGPSSASSLGCPFHRPRPSPTRVLPPMGPVSVPVSVMGSHPHPCCLLVCLCLLSWAGWSSLEPWSRDRQDPGEEPQASPDPVCEAHQGRGGAQVFRKLSPLMGPQTLKVGPGQRVPLGSRDQGLGAADEQGRLAMQASPGGPEGALTLRGVPSAGSGFFPCENALQTSWLRLAHFPGSPGPSSLLLSAGLGACLEAGTRELQPEGTPGSSHCQVTTVRSRGTM